MLGLVTRQASELFQSYTASNLVLVEVMQPRSYPFGGVTANESVLSSSTAHTYLIEGYTGTLITFWEWHGKQMILFEVTRHTSQLR